jgi:tetratricopeptide (TPR) repeat protein
VLRLDPGEELSDLAAAILRRAVVRPQFSGYESCVLEQWTLRLVRREQCLDGYPVARIEDEMINRFDDTVHGGEPTSTVETPDEVLSRCDLTDEMGLGGSQNEYERAKALFNLGEIEEGLAASARCLAIEWPEDLGSEAMGDRYALRGKLLATKGDYEAAAEMFELAVQANPNHDDARVEWGRSWERMGKFDAALSVYLSGQESPIIGVACLAGAGRACARLGLAKRSADLFREAWRRNTADATAWMAWVEAAAAYGDPAGIVEAYGACGETPTLPASGFAAWASALQALGNLTEAADKYRQAIALPDATASEYFALAAVYAELEQDADAAECLEAGLGQEPENLSAWLTLGQTLQRLGLMHGARISCQRALAIDPDFSPARQLLDRICQAA